MTTDGFLSDGTERYESPSQAARLMTGQKAVNGWAFWMTDEGRSIGELRA